MRTLKCPVCNNDYPRVRLVFPLGSGHCPHCNSKLSLTKRSNQFINVVASITFMAVVVYLGPRRLFSWPSIALFMLIIFSYFQVLTMIFAELEQAREESRSARFLRYIKPLIVTLILVVLVTLYLYFRYHTVR